MPEILAILGMAFLLALSLTPPIREIARRRGVLDQPDGWRKRHPIPVPRLGGVAVYLAFVAALAGYLWLARAAVWHAELTEAYLSLVVASTAVMLVGLLDDLVGVRPLAKILVQAAAGVYLYGNGYRIELLSNPFGETLALGPLSLPLTLLWLVGMSNALNLIDGLDGLAAGVGLFAASASFVAALVNERWEIALLCAALAGALLGFLRYNFAPASIFLGDCGSLFLGFVLAALAVRGSMKSSTAIAIFVPLLALALPILDTAMAVLRRMLRRRGLFEPDAEHIHHRMLRQGLTPARVAFTLYGVAALFGALSLLTVAGNAQIVGVVVIVFSVVTWFGVQRLGYPELGAAQEWLLGLSRPGNASGADLSELLRRLAEAQGVDELWQGLTWAAGRFRLRRLELRLEEDPPRRSGPRIWISGEPAEAEAWDCTIPLPSQGRSLGRLAITGSVAGGRLSAPDSALLEALSRDFCLALERVLGPASGGAGSGQAPLELPPEGSRSARSR
jgi:UDP-GlcNAc:undecaprenyl-phosphate GlcNAc-1-phosphate transferase